MEEIKSIYQALLGVQKEVFSVKKSANNPFFKSKYVDYISLQKELFPVLNEAGLIVTQPTVVIDGKNYVKTIVTHAETGQSIESITEIIFKAGDAQAQGSGITYARRYGLMSLVAIGADDDDDGNKATGRVPLEKLTSEMVKKGMANKVVKYLSTFNPDDFYDYNKGLEKVRQKFDIERDAYSALEFAVRAMREANTANAN